MEQNKLNHNEGVILAAKARDEFIDTGKSTVKCPKCNQCPEIDIQGSNYSHIYIKCSCGYIKLYQKGI